MRKLVYAYDVEHNIRQALKDVGSRDDESLLNCIRIGIEASECVEPGIKRGYWKLFVNGGAIEVLCSECNQGNSVFGDDKYESLCCFATRYCPECGALMSNDKE